jgi:hypothetical protein
MSRRRKKRCAVCGQDIVPDLLVDPGNPPHCNQACTTAHPTRAHHRMVTLAKSSPSRSTPRPSQNENATVMLEPASPAVPTAAADKQHYDYDDQESCGVHTVLLTAYERDRGKCNPENQKVHP